MKSLKPGLNVFISLSIFTTTTVRNNVYAVTAEKYKMHARSEKKIASAFYEFRFDMTVDWDKQDPYFKQYAQVEYENSLATLSAEGGTVEKIQAFLEKSILNENVRDDYLRLLNTLKKQKFSEDEASETVMKFMERSSAQGTSFSSGSCCNFKENLFSGRVVPCLITRKYKKDDTSSSSIN
jgi:hypothetical protein